MKEKTFADKLDNDAEIFKGTKEEELIFALQLLKDAQGLIGKEKNNETIR